MLRHGDTEDGVRPGVIGKFVVQTSGGLTATLQRLERAGRVDRTDDPADARGRRVMLNDDGRAFYDAVFADLVDRYGMVFADADIAGALPAVRQMVGAFERHAHLPTKCDWDVSAASKG